MPTRLVHIYVDAEVGSPLSPAAEDQTRAGTIALSLRDQMRQRGFDVREPEATMPPGEAGLAPRTMVRAVAEGQPPPASSRSITYLHPHAPRLLLFVHLQEDPQLGKGPRAPSLALGAFIADSSDGTILWSNRITARPPASDHQLRQLAVELLRTLPNPPAG